MLFEFVLYQPESGQVLGLAIIVSLLIDRVFGEPSAIWHPVVWMGHYLSWSGQALAPTVSAGEQRPALLFLMGSLAIVLPIFLLGYLAWYTQQLVATLAWYWQGILMGCLLKPLFSWRMLYQEVESVEIALQSSLNAGRVRLARLVSRDVQNLDVRQIRESAIETLAENVNDSVIAALLWFVLLGLPGALIYRFVNTADAMWGYRGVRQGRIWTWTGKCAARLDDILSWPGARLTALMMCIVTCRFPILDLLREAKKTSSPNGGWPMGAMAILLNVRLTKPGFYILCSVGDCANSSHVTRSLQLCQRVVNLVLLLCALAVLLGLISPSILNKGVLHV